MEKNDILVSIITPTYQREKDILDRSLKSIINQSYRNIEIIIVDDNPEDSVYRHEISKYINTIKDERILYIKNKNNLGGALSRNVGIKNAHGDYITFLDDDDIYLKDKIKNQLSCMIRENLDLTFTNLKIVNEDNKIVDQRSFDFIENFENDRLMRYHLTRNLTGTPTFMFKTEALKKIGGFDDVKMGHEFYLMYKAIDNGLKIRHIPISDVRAYRTKSKSISNGDNKISGENEIYKFKKSNYDKLTKEEQKFVEFRHRAVLAVVYKRRKNFTKMITNLICMFFVSPKYTFIEGNKFIRNYFKNN